MADPFVAEIRAFGFNFAPTGWAQCAGQLLPLSQNTALCSLLGTTYGGNGKSNFALPNLEGMTPIGAGQGPGLSDVWLGETGGSETVSLLESEIPAHSHAASVSPDEADLAAPAANRSRARAAPGTPYATTGPLVAMAPEALTPAGGDQPHNNMPPSLAVGMCIALQGVFPPRT